MKFKEKNFDKKNVSDAVQKVSAYVPGEQPKGGGWIKLNTNELPYPPSPKAVSAVKLELGSGEKLRLYPDPSSFELRSAIAKFFGLKPENVLAGNGSDDVLNLAVRAFSDKARKIASFDPCYTLYPVLAKIQGSEIVHIPIGKDFKLDIPALLKSGANILFFTNPNAPTGFGFDEKTVAEILEKFDGLVLVDEAYAPFAKYSAAKFVGKYPNLIVSGTLSKGWGLAGMRVGWALGSPAVISTLDKVRDSYNLDRLAQAAGAAAISDKKYHAKVVSAVLRERKKAESFFDKLGWQHPKSSSNFLLVEPKTPCGKSGPKQAGELFEFLKSKKVLVRYFPNSPEINSKIRITIGTPEQMAALEKRVLEWIEKRTRECKCGSLNKQKTKGAKS